MNFNRWAVILGVLLLAAVVGGLAYNAGVARGAEQSGKIVAWHGHHGLGFFWFPLFFFAFLLLGRGLFWHRRGYRCHDERLDEWHQRAHERMKDA